MCIRDSLYTEDEIKGIIGLKEDKGTFEPVSYTHLTLPTN
ncbi:hypothetical protein JMUB7530_28080 [Staphylococcus aureus]